MRYVPASVRAVSLVVPAALLVFSTGGCDRADAAGAPVVAQASSSVSAVGGQADANFVDGQRWYNQSCAACHGFAAQGMPHQGPPLRDSGFIADQTDDELVEFIKVGRLPSDPKSVMKLVMPPKGTNPSLTDRQIGQIVVYLRTMQAGRQTASAAVE